MPFRSLLLLAFLPLSYPVAQQQQSISTCGPLQVTVSPDPAPFGERIVVEATNVSTSLVGMPQPCLLMAVHQRSPSGPVIASWGCIQISTFLAPGASMKGVWDQKGAFGQVDPGTYYLEVLGAAGAGPSTCFAPVQVGGCEIGSLKPFGSDCGTSTCFYPGPPALHPQTCPEIGTIFALTLVNGDCGAPAVLIMGASKTGWGALPLPFDLGGGCLLHVSVDAVFTVPISYGKTTFEVPIPNDPSLHGASAYFQGGTFKDGVLKLTRGLEAVIG